MKRMGIPFSVCPAKINEEELFENWVKEKVQPADIAKMLSHAKATSLADEYPNQFILGADTLVSIDNNEEKILGKPQNVDEAFQFLKWMSGKKHFVITGYTWCCKKQNYFKSVALKTEVFVKTLTDKDIQRYINNNDILDAAGAYKIQSFYPEYIERINGSYFNVVGLPVESVFNSYIQLTEK